MQCSSYFSWVSYIIPNGEQLRESTGHVFATVKSLDEALFFLTIYLTTKYLSGFRGEKIIQSFQEKELLKVDEANSFQWGKK